MAEELIAWDLRDILTNCSVLYCPSHTHIHTHPQNWGNLNNNQLLNNNIKFLRLFFKCDNTLFFNFYIEKWNSADGVVRL